MYQNWFYFPSRLHLSTSLLWLEMPWHFLCPIRYACSWTPAGWQHNETWLCFLLVTLWPMWHPLLWINDQQLVLHQSSIFPPGTLEGCCWGMGSFTFVLVHVLHDQNLFLWSCESFLLTMYSWKVSNTSVFSHKFSPWFSLYMSIWFGANKPTFH